jgi:hypothetical protein
VSILDFEDALLVPAMDDVDDTFVGAFVGLFVSTFVISAAGASDGALDTVDSSSSLAVFSLDLDELDVDPFDEEGMLTTVSLPPTPTFEEPAFDDDEELSPFDEAMPLLAKYPFPLLLLLLVLAFEDVGLCSLEPLLLEVTDLDFFLGSSGSSMHSLLLGFCVLDPLMCLPPPALLLAPVPLLPLLLDASLWLDDMDISSTSRTPCSKNQKDSASNCLLVSLLPTTLGPSVTFRVGTSSSTIISGADVSFAVVDLDDDDTALDDPRVLL